MRARAIFRENLIILGFVILSLILRHRLFKTQQIQENKIIEYNHVTRKWIKYHTQRESERQIVIDQCVEKTGDL